MTQSPWVNKNNLGLLTDLYELTMLQAYRAEGMNGRAVFSLYFRNMPPARNFMLACGQGEVLELIRAIRFDRHALDHLAGLGRFGDDFLDYLGGFRFTGDIYAVPEGTPVFPQEPIMEVEAPIGEAQLLESLVMNQVHLQTVLASAAVRFKLAARGRSVVDFGLRRMHGTDAAVRGVRAYRIAGLDATSNVLAGPYYDMPVTGTMAHSYIQAHEDERAAFRAFTGLYPDTTLLIDTYDTIEGVQRAIELSRESGGDFRFSAVRLDSGDVMDLSRQVRTMLDEAGLSDVKILASGGLDEYEIERLVDTDAPIDGFGVGTHLGVSSSAPALDLAYKLTEYDDRGRYKDSPGKTIYPGAKQVFRIDEGRPTMHDIVAARDESHDGCPLLQRVVRNGELTDPEFAHVAPARERVAAALEALPDSVKSLKQGPTPYNVQISPRLERALDTVRDRV